MYRSSAAARIFHIVQCECGACYLRRPSAVLATSSGAAHCERCGVQLASWQRGFGAVVLERAVEAKKTG